MTKLGMHKMAEYVVCEICGCPEEMLMINSNELWEIINDIDDNIENFKAEYWCKCCRQDGLSGMTKKEFEKNKKKPSPCERNIWVCKTCSGENVQQKSWTYMNTDELVDYIEDGEYYCEDCQSEYIHVVDKAFINEVKEKKNDEK